MAGRKNREMVAVVGGNISRRRKELGLTQALLAEKLGIGTDSLSRIEKGVVAPRLERLTKISSELDCAVADLFRMEGDPLSVSLDALADLLRPLAPGTQEDLVRLMTDMVRVVRKSL